MKFSFIDVHVGLPLEGPFTYKIPESAIVQPGMRVRVNFNNKKLIGYIQSVHDNEPKEFEAKEILDVLDAEPIYDQRLIDLVEYVSYSYISTKGEAYQLALPSGERPSSRYKIPFDSDSIEPSPLSEEQQNIFNDIVSQHNQGAMAHLIFGVTGSGKTEIYIHLAKKITSEGKSVIFLVPEISLSSQIFERLYALFGDEMILYHSHLTANQRLYNWNRFLKGEAKIAVGTRSAIFLQCPDLGMIIFDEEHDGSYKENSTPRYNAKRLGFYRSRNEQAMLLFGSATPSVESLYATTKGQINLHRLNQRYGKGVLPEVQLVKISNQDGGVALSSILKLFIKKAHDEKKQSILLLNRRGFSPLLICDDCGWIAECPHCSISLNFHKQGHFVCHYCGFKAFNLKNCKECGSINLQKIGSGTQRIEEMIENEFRDFKVFRLDQDTSRKKGTIFNLLEQMNNGEVDILVGTQMVAKGFNFQNVTVVGVMLADIGMNIPDFRASERVFALLMQVAGRSGRSDDKGKVIIQTFNEEYEIFAFLKNHDYEGFYMYELENRKMLGYPPFQRLARLLIRGEDESNVIKYISDLAAIIKSIIGNNKEISLLGPTSAPIGKISNKFRHHILLKAKSQNILRDIIVKAKEKLEIKNVYLEIDIDPMDII